jgi:hypothetical protein
MTIFCILHYLCCLALVGLIGLAPASAQDTAGKIEGRVVDRQKNLPLAKQAVMLKIHQGDETQQRETTTDENGRYVFANLSTAYDIHYTVSTTYGGEEHAETDLVLSEWTPEIKVNIEIGGFIDDPSAVKVRQHTLVITPPPEGHAPDGAVSVMEILQIENTSEVEFQTTMNNRPAGMYFNLPSGYEELRIDQIFKQNLNAAGDQLVAAEALPPGKHNVGFSYVMHVGANRSLNLARTLTFDADQFYVFVAQGVPLAPQTSILGPGRQEQIHDMVYMVYATNPAQPLTAGQTVDLRLKVTSTAPGAQGAAEMTDSPAPKDPKMIAMIAVAAALAGGFLVAGILRVAAGSTKTEEAKEASQASPDASWLRKLDAADLERARIARLEMITRLEELYEKRELSERVYNRLRKEQIDRLAAVLEHLKR